MPEGRRIALIGPGAIGTTIAAALHEAGRAPLLCGRTARDRLALDAAGTRIVVPGPVLTEPAAVDGPADLVFLAVKGTQTTAARPWLEVLCGTETVVCVLQNGVEQEEAVTPLAAGATVIPAVVWFPAETQSDGSVRLHGEARLTLPDRPASQTVLDALRGTRCIVDTAGDFTSVAWRKLLQNAAAGLMALTGRRAGVFRRDDIAALTLDYVRECLAVARAAGAQLDDETPQAILDGFRAQPIDRGTSILADRESGRALEWDVRNGVVQRVGRALGVATPISDVVVPLLAATSDG
ncbi:oxidoreductase [Gryllotalpicola daejeonensis]|uniref:Oxidoreductase n=1 Tax=Gryllotalpicola daejeonensis TaxID=993087 RepID=A0ABP7ZD35_9MICO